MSECPSCGREYRNDHDLPSGGTVYVHGVEEMNVGEHAIASVTDKCVVDDDSE